MVRSNYEYFLNLSTNSYCNINKHINNKYLIKKYSNIFFKRLSHDTVVLLSKLTMMNDLKTILASCRLYGILDLGYVTQEHAMETARAMLKGGVKILQLRAKNVPLETVESLASQLVPLCREFGCISIINDYPEIAVKCDADGVHVGQDTPDLDVVRRLLGPGKIVGRSTHSIEQAHRGWQEGADYIGFGPLFPTPTKPGRPAIGLEGIAEINRILPSEFPVFCIGGVNESTLSQVLAAGARRVVIVSWLLTHPQVEETAQDLVDMLDQQN